MISYGKLMIRRIIQMVLSLHQKVTDNAQLAITVWVGYLRFSDACQSMLTTWSRILLEKLRVTPVVKKFLTFYGTLKFITILTWACHWSLS
jgi:hypothetical protein